MYYIYISKESPQGFIYANMSDKAWTAKDNFELLETHEFEEQMKAVRFMRNQRRICKKHNIAIDPNYIPPSKRTERAQAVMGLPA